LKSHKKFIERVIDLKNKILVKQVLIIKMFPIDENSGSSKSMDKSLNKMMNLDKMEKVIKGKAALGLKKFNDFKEKVRIEAMEMQINRCDDNKRLKELHGGWTLDKKQMQYLMTNPYVYNASAGSYLELLFLQK